MPVISSRRYSSNSYLTPSSTTSSSVGSYRSNYSSLSSATNTSSTKDLPTSTSRYNFGESSYRSSYRPSVLSSSGISSTSGTTGSYRSRYDYDDLDKKKTTSSSLSSSSSLSTRIGVSKTSSSSHRYNSDTLPPLPPTASSSSVTNSNLAHNYVHSKRSLSRSRDQNDSGESNGVGSTKNSDRSTSASNGKMSLMNDLDFYEKYSPSRYMTKYELSRSRSHSEAAPTPTHDKSPSSSLNNDTPSHTPKCEVCRLSHHFVLSFISFAVFICVTFFMFHCRNKTNPFLSATKTLTQSNK